ncbi:ribbon-helix-helix protein, CopG family [Arthrobacter sp. YAF34]|jgi:hypothetical protein|uniref:ribbon-helix-helix protein, CopG family n=1 Tax=Arthrobacter sp. YAF34 TaxID=3233083 RepID=UPI003F8F7AB8
MPAKDPNLVRLNVNMNKETAAALKELTDKHGISFTEAVRRAIVVYQFIDHEKDQGKKVFLTDADETRKTEFVLL